MKDKGYFTRIVTEVVREMGARPHYRFLPWKRCEYAVLQGNAWAAFPYAQNEARARKFLFSDVVDISVTRFFYYNNALKDVPWDTLSDLKPYRIGGVVGYFYREDFEHAGLNVEYTSGELLNLKKLTQGRIDLFPVNERVGWSLIRQHFPNEKGHFGVLEKPHIIQGLRLMIRKNDPASRALLDRFNQALQHHPNRGRW